MHTVPAQPAPRAVELALVGVVVEAADGAEILAKLRSTLCAPI